GIFIWTKCSGSYIDKGEVLGFIKDPYGYSKTEVICKYAGYIIGHNNASVVNHGDALFHIGIEYENNY
ncbi:MAG TPA: succinylglutamate desuccinylase, partial [Saprospiraceae bacterium]|nr:succinylglutamate desuccinylase [Saprospiraceae bacterium]